MTLAFYLQLADQLNTNAVVVATVIQIRGSVPREVGAKMMIWAEAQTSGTIGGGAGEAKVIQTAQQVLITGEKQFVEIDLSGVTHRETQGICGGLMTLWLERWQGESARHLTQQIIARLRAGRAVTLITPLDQTRSPFIHSSPHPPPPSPSPFDFTEILQPPPTLLIVGAGHCGRQLAKVADLVGFQVMVQDDRPEWANASYYPQVAQVFTAAIADVVTQLADHTQLYAALVTRGYGYDLAALKALLQREVPCQYIGMIGSQKRVHQVFEAVAEAGFTAAQLQTVHAPIGLDIGALTPEEIAISITAELILVRRGGTGRPLSTC
ncbi:MAG: XdhC/CoxI family protein [Leptolyngbyaceae cyanobacterium bins.349]|nr:XdhC/CoxI family protein [Leptolyngbyaceae cyanobacterium bins.349]